MQNRHSHPKKSYEDAVQLLLLGPMQVYVDGQQVDVTARKARALLANLALRWGEAVPRETLAGLFWGDREEEQARASLRQTLSGIRKMLGDADAHLLKTTNESVTLMREGIWIDVASLEKDPEACSIEELVEMVELYRGDLLEGLSINEPEFDQWLLVEREKARTRISGVLSRLIVRMEEDRHVEKAIAYAARLLAMDPLQEHIHRKLMFLYMAQGRLDAALNQFEQCKKELDQQLRVAPEQATLDIAKKIRVLRLGTQPNVDKDQHAQTNASAMIKSKSTQQMLPTLDKPSIAILPFENISGDPEQEYFSDGITEDLITELSRFRELAIISRNSSFAHRGRNELASEVGAKLNAQYLVLGSVRKAGSKVRVTAKLMDAQSNVHIWAERYERSLEDIFQVQDDLVRRIAGTLVGRLEYERQSKTMSKSKNQLKAYDLYLRGRKYFVNWSSDHNRNAGEVIQSALAIEPEYAAALALMSEILFRQWFNGWSEDPDLDLVDSLSFAMKADELDDQDSRIQSALGMAYLFHNKFDKAKVHFNAGIKLNPNDTRTLVRYSWHALIVGDSNTAAELCTKALNLDPYGKHSWNLGLACFAAHKYEEAIELHNSIRNPVDNVLAILAASYGAAGDQANAAATLDRFLHSASVSPVMSKLNNPNEWREYFSARWPFRNKEDIEHLLGALHIAGLPI